MDLLEDISNIKRTIERTLGINLQDEDFADGREEIEHIFLHEACHAAIAHCVPWIHALEEREHTAVDELMVRLLEKEIAESLGMFVHSTEKFLAELGRYPVDITQEDYEQLQTLWDAYFWLRKDLAGMATTTLAFLRYGDLIYHLLPKADWEQAQRTGIYKPIGLAKGGFIHCSKIDQVVDVANRYYGGHLDMVLLGIAVNKVGADIRYEDLLGEGERFPHIYGALSLDAVVCAPLMKADEEGKFLLPTGPSALTIYG